MLLCGAVSGCWLGEDDLASVRDASWLSELDGSADTAAAIPEDTTVAGPPPSLSDEVPLMPPGLGCAQSYLEGDPPWSVDGLAAPGSAVRPTSCEVASPTLAVGWTAESAGCFEAYSPDGLSMAVFRGCAGRELTCVAAPSPRVRRAVSPGESWLILVEGDAPDEPVRVHVEATDAAAWDVDLGAESLVLHDGSSDGGSTALGPVSCASSVGATVLRWVAPSSGVWRFEARSLIGDLVLSLHEPCSGAELACADALGFDPLRGEVVDRELGVGEVVLLRVAAYRVGGLSMNMGAWTLGVSRR